MAFTQEEWAEYKKKTERAIEYHTVSKVQIGRKLRRKIEKQKRKEAKNAEV